MKFIKGNYTKADGTTRVIDVMVMNNSKEDFNGIDLTLLDEPERTQVLLLTQQYEDMMKPYAKKAFRSMKHAGVEKPNAQ